MSCHVMSCSVETLISRLMIPPGTNSPSAEYQLSDKNVDIKFSAHDTFVE